MPNRFEQVAVLPAIAALAAFLGLGVGYLLWGKEPNWYRAPNASSLPDSPENDLIRYGWQLIVDTPSHIGKSAPDLSMRFAGNNLACTQCHMNAGLKPYAAPLVSTFGSFPSIYDDKFLTLAERINGCMVRSMNGKPIPENSREMNAFISYIRFIGKDSPEGVRVPGMGLKSLKAATLKPDITRGEKVYAKNCATCHGAQGQGQARLAPDIGFSIPPLWGPESFNGAAGMSRLETAAAFVHANMPYNISYKDPVLSEQEAWDVAAFMTSQPRPPAPAK